MYFPIKKGFFLREVGSVKAVDGVSFDLKKGQTLGLVGESGCGKSTLGRAICRLYNPTAGSISFEGKDITHIHGEELRTMRREIQMIFQDPYASLDPRQTVSRIVGEPLRVHKMGSKSEIEKRVAKLLDIVGLKSTDLNKYPHEFSGGQRQRIGIARAIALNPEVIICDEPVSALDVSIQAQVLNLLKDLQKEFNLTYLFISHDLSVVEHLCDEIAVMYLGQIVEKADRDTLFSHPTHPYTQALLKAIPRVGKGRVEKRVSLKGDVPSPIHPPKGCAFHTRCEFKTDKCLNERPNLEQINNNHHVSCWHRDQFLIQEVKNESEENSPQLDHPRTPSQSRDSGKRSIEQRA